MSSEGTGIIHALLIMHAGRVISDVGSSGVIMSVPFRIVEKHAIQ